MNIRSIEKSDWPAVWQLIEPVFRAGETYAFSPDISERESQQVWIENPKATYVAIDEKNNIVGTYYIKANQPTLGAHVCNCGYIVGERARGKGVASAMCEHSQQEATRLGFLAMQFNLVVATNIGAIRLWQKMGFETIGTLPNAFRTPKSGFVDALVMYKKLDTLMR